MYTIRASSLGTFNVSPYKYKYGKFDGDPLILELGNIMHYYTRDRVGGKLLLDSYTANLKKDLKLDHMMRKHFDNLDGLLDKINAKAEYSWDEISIPFKVIDNCLITGTADKVVKFKDEEDIIDVFDRKTTGSIDRYADKYRKKEYHPEPRIREENLQWLAYGYAAMLLSKTNNCRFHFVALEKKSTAKMQLFTKEFTFDEGFNKLVDVCNRFVEASELDLRPHNHTRYCFFPGGCGEACPQNDKNKNKF